MPRFYVLEVLVVGTWVEAESSEDAEGIVRDQGGDEFDLLESSQIIRVEQVEGD